jgi:hypothetical protein
MCAGVDYHFFPYAGEYRQFVDLSPAYRFSWTSDKASNQLHIMIQVTHEHTTPISARRISHIIANTWLVVPQLGLGGDRV